MSETSTKRRKAWGRTIATVRQEHGYKTQGQLAAALGISKMAVNYWERGHASPSDDMRGRIAGLFGCEVSDLFPIVAEKPETEAAS